MVLKLWLLPNSIQMFQHPESVILTIFQKYHKYGAGDPRLLSREECAFSSFLWQFAKKKVRLDKPSGLSHVGLLAWVSHPRGSSLWQALTSATNFSPQKAQAFLDGIFLCHNAPAWQLVPTGYYALSHTNCGDEPAAARLCHASCFEKLRPSPRRFVRSQRAQGPILYTGIRPGILRIQQVSVSAPLLRSMTLLRPFSITQ